MPLSNNIQVVMEKTPAYFDHTPYNMPEKMKSSIPNVKLILVVCEPVARAFSDYVHEVGRHLPAKKIILLGCASKLP